MRRLSTGITLRVAGPPKPKNLDRKAKSPKLFSKGIWKLLDSTDGAKKREGKKIAKQFFKLHLKKFLTESGGRSSSRKLRQILGLEKKQFDDTMDALDHVGIVEWEGKGNWKTTPAANSKKTPKKVVKKPKKVTKPSRRETKRPPAKGEGWLTGYGVKGYPTPTYGPLGVSKACTPYWKKKGRCGDKPHCSILHPTRYAEAIWAAYQAKGVSQAWGAAIIIFQRSCMKATGEKAFHNQKHAASEVEALYPVLNASAVRYYELCVEGAADEDDFNLPSMNEIDQFVANELDLYMPMEAKKEMLFAKTLDNKDMMMRLKTGSTLKVSGPPRKKESKLYLYQLSVDLGQDEPVRKFFLTSKRVTPGGLSKTYKSKAKNRVIYNASGFLVRQGPESAFKFEPKTIKKAKNGGVALNYVWSSKYLDFSRLEKPSS